jgi:small nuclear ribonucleoprotein (snRNP)-like protein
MDKYLIERFYTNQTVIIKKINGEKVYGAIVGFEPTPISLATHLLLIENLNKEEYKKTLNKNLLTRINYNDIKNIKYQIDY